MSRQTDTINPICGFLPTDIEGADPLIELALDMRWSWNHTADQVWEQLDPVLWRLTGNPWVVLQTISRDQLQRALSDTGFRSKVNELVEADRQEVGSNAWFQKAHTESPLTAVAYFSMEFMLSEALPIYSGGLGNVAGDQLKAASDLGVPVIGVGLLYQQGYFRQVIDREGNQQAFFPYNDPGQLPITPLRDVDGEWLRLEIPLPGYSVWLRAWQVQVGRVKLYLLDSNDLASFPAHRGITSELYGGGPELRLKQELLLGIGGWRLLRALGIKPEVCHLNEGHAAFVVLERARSFMEETGQSFEVALAVTRAGNIFTTHTPVAAGFDRFSPEIIKQHMGRYAEMKLGIPIQDLLALGRENPDDSSENFNMAYLAMRGSGAANGVSLLHSKVSRRIFEPLFPRWPIGDVPIGHVTNGIHIPTWESTESDNLWSGVCGEERWLGTMEGVADQIRGVEDSMLWQCRASSRQTLVEFVRERLALQLAASGALPDACEKAKTVFNTNALTLGFARRFAAYKRPNLLLYNPERLLRILTNRHYPVQLIIAGKAHPADETGRNMIREWIHFIETHRLWSNLVFLGDYDMFLTTRLVQGVDVWINTPRRPWEACGTSGMKVLVNGGINLSELDGWWAEAYDPEVGWALGDGKEHGEDPLWDAAEAEALYKLLEDEVIPEFYQRDENGIPKAWVTRMRESMARLTPHFSANRAVREYTEKYYIPAATAFRKRSTGSGETGIEIAKWHRAIEQKWTSLRFGDVNVKTDGDRHLLEVQVYLNGLNPDYVHVELYAAKTDDQKPVVQEMIRVRQLVGAENGYVYSASLPATRPVTDFTARIIPYHPDVAVPFEAKQILWQR